MPGKNAPTYRMKGFSGFGNNKKTPLENKNLLDAVPNKETFDKMSDLDKKNFTEAAKKSGTIPMMTSKKSPATMYDKKSPAKNYKKGYYGA